jgi:RNA polymerase sigma-54 factor
MGLMQRLELRQGQSLVMTPQLLQAIKLLQLSHLDLAAHVEAELERNPLLERPLADDGAEERPALFEHGPSEDAETGHDAERADAWLQNGGMVPEPIAPLDNVFPDDGPNPSGPPSDAGEVLPLTSSPWIGGGGTFDDETPEAGGALTLEPSLHDHLVAQLDLATRDPAERLIGRHLIDAINEAGYLAEDVEAVADRLGATAAAVERVLGYVQAFDPAGVGARSLSECLAIQLKERNRFDPAMQALLERLDLVGKRDLATLRRICGVDGDDLAEMLAELRRLDPKPGRAFWRRPVEFLIPDVVVRGAPDGSWIVELNPDALPRVLVNQTYYARVSRSAKTEADKSFLSDCLQNANWLVRSLEQRAKTILKVATEIVRQQDGFFAHGVAHLRPLNLKTVADAIGMHESTVSRVTSNKAIATRRGTFEMKFFFTAAIPGAAGANAHSSEAVRHRIKQLIEREGADDILSDDALVRRLRADGVDIARRTVAKYRESLRIPSSIERRRDKMPGALR